MATVTPEYIQNQLHYYNDAAQKYHHDTKSFAEHKALGHLYEELNGFRDDILELVMGYTGKRIGQLKRTDIPVYSNEEVLKMVNGLKDFAYEVYEWAEDKKYCDVENTAQDLSGLASKTLYMLTLS